MAAFRVGAGTSPINREEFSGVDDLGVCIVYLSCLLLCKLEVCSSGGTLAVLVALADCKRGSRSLSLSGRRDGGTSAYATVYNGIPSARALQMEDVLSVGAEEVDDLREGCGLCVVGTDAVVVVVVIIVIVVAVSVGLSNRSTLACICHILPLHELASS